MDLCVCERICNYRLLLAERESSTLGMSAGTSAISLLPAGTMLFLLHFFFPFHAVFFQSLLKNSNL